MKLELEQSVFVCTVCGSEITPVEAQYYDGRCRVCFYTNKEDSIE